jgi:mono/diheme cytochrome c family protein
LSFAVASVWQLASPPAHPWRGADGAPALYREHCAACHGETRLGGIGPALLPENLERLRKPKRSKSSVTGGWRRRCRPSATS